MRWKWNKVNQEEWSRMSVSHWNVVESYEKHKEQPTAYVRRIPNNQDVDYKIVPFQDARICMLWFGDE